MTEHLCRQQHGMTITEDDTTRLSEDVRCHDCGAEMAHPPGVSATTWICPRIHFYRDEHDRAPKIAKGQAFECGATA